ncbi:MAG: hypothetical protein K6G15_04270 [Desulfovibrio sp.]|nr:hypothetical protein [Desulfovibrio sp.]
MAFSLDACAGQSSKRTLIHLALSGGCFGKPKRLRPLVDAKGKIREQGAVQPLMGIIPGHITEAVFSPRIANRVFHAEIR